MSMRRGEPAGAVVCHLDGEMGTVSMRRGEPAGAIACCLNGEKGLPVSPCEVIRCLTGIHYPGCEFPRHWLAPPKPKNPCRQNHPNDVECE